MSLGSIGCWFALAAAAATVAPASGDEVVLRGRPPFRDVRVSDLRDGKLVFRGLSEQYLRKPLTEVDRVTITELETFSAAENALANGDAAAAVPLYEAALAARPTAWQRELIRFRLLRALDRPETFDRAVEAYVGLARERPRLAPPHAPRHPAPAGSDRNRAALALLARHARSGSSALRDAILPLAVGLWYLEEQPGPPTAAGLAALSRGETETPADEDEELPALLRPPTRPTRHATAPAEPSPDRAPMGVVLAADHFLADAARAALENGDAARARRLLDALRPHLVLADRPALDDLLARAELGCGAVREAADRWQRLAESSDDRAMALRARYHSGEALERLGEWTAAEAAFRAILAADDAPAGLRELATEALRRLGPDPPGAP